jgi:hypothetical protein
MQARCCCDPQNALVEERCAIPAVMQARCHDPQNALVEEGCAIPAASCMQAAVMIHRMLWWKKVCYPCAAMQARCCCDSQNALVQEGVLYLRCHASSLLL